MGETQQFLRQSLEASHWSRRVSYGSRGKRDIRQDVGNGEK